MPWTARARRQQILLEEFDYPRGVFSRCFEDPVAMAISGHDPEIAPVAGRAGDSFCIGGWNDPVALIVNYQNPGRTQVVCGFGWVDLPDRVTQKKSRFPQRGLLQCRI